MKTSLTLSSQIRFERTKHFHRGETLSILLCWEGSFIKKKCWFFKNVPTSILCVCGNANVQDFLSFPSNKIQNCISLLLVVIILEPGRPEEDREWFLEVLLDPIFSVSVLPPPSHWLSASVSESSSLRMSPGICKLLEVLCRPRFP